MKFNDILGHENIKSEILKVLEAKRAAQGYIFEGKKGIGKTMMAKIFAAALFCLNFNKEPCEKCPNCMKMKSGNHPDFYWMEPEGNSIKNKQIETFHQFITLKPFLGEKKIIVIKDAHAMTISAQNKILKTLEEPPGDAVIIFVTDQIRSLLPTVISRCQVFSFQRLSKETISSFLMDNYELSEEKAKGQAIFADGSLLQACQNILDENFLKLHEEALSFIDFATQKNKVDVLRSCEILEEQKDQLDMALTFMELWVRDLVFVHLKMEQSVFFHSEQKERLKAMAQRRSLIKWIQTIDRIERAKEQKRAYVQAGLILEALAMDIQEDYRW